MRSKISIFAFYALLGIVSITVCEASFAARPTVEEKDALIGADESAEKDPI